MIFFKGRRKANNDTVERESLGAKFSRHLIKQQSVLAERLNASAAKIPARKLKAALVLFCFVSGGLSSYLAINGVFAHNPVTNVIPIDQASVPKHFDRSGDEIRDVENSIDAAVYQQVKIFRSYMDSLQKNDGPTYDSILLSRPGLMDSITTIEGLYLSQQIK